MRAAFASPAPSSSDGPGAAAFRDAPDVLRVRLFGPSEIRAQRGCAPASTSISRRRAGSSSRSTAPRDQYVRRLYRISVDDPDVFQLQIDSTAIPIEACVEVIAAAYRGMIG